VPLEQIKHMAKTKPQAVAMLLKGWMMEDGR
jgi:flagellar biosynthesis/type III secretory pathway M-ring protein FliF/YscJ